MEWVFVGSGFAIGVLIAVGVGYKFWRRAELRAVQNDNRITELQIKLDNETAHHCTAEKERDEWRKKCDAEREEKDTAKIESATAMTRADEKQKAADELCQENEKLHEQTKSDAADIAELNNELKNVQQQADEKVASLKEVRESMEAEFKNLSQNILEEKGKKFDENSKRLLEPLKNQILEFRNRVDSIHQEETAARSSLKTGIESLQTKAAEYGKSADNLALALKGDSKVQGDWGEMQLGRLLEQSGLQEGKDYTKQESVRDTEGNLLRPDVMVGLPKNRHLIVDSKVSLRDYETAFTAENEESQNAALVRHVRAVRSHIKSLSGKHYARAEGLNAPDFVFMFMAIEPAYIEAMRREPNLFKEALAKNIVLCSPTGLMAMLCTVAHIWQLEQQNQNAQEIAKQGEKIYDKFYNFYKSMHALGSALGSASKSYNEACGQLRTGKGNLTRSVEKLRELGVKVDPQKAELPQLPVLDEVENDEK